VCPVIVIKVPPFLDPLDGVKLVTTPFVVKIKPVVAKAP